MLRPAASTATHRLLQAMLGQTGRCLPRRTSWIFGASVPFLLSCAEPEAKALPKALRSPRDSRRPRGRLGFIAHGLWEVRPAADAVPWGTPCGLESGGREIETPAPVATTTQRALAALPSPQGDWSEFGPPCAWAFAFSNGSPALGEQLRSREPTGRALGVYNTSLAVWPGSSP